MSFTLGRTPRQARIDPAPVTLRLDRRHDPPHPIRCVHGNRSKASFKVSLTGSSGIKIMPYERTRRGLPELQILEPAPGGALRRPGCAAAEQALRGNQQREFSRATLSVNGLASRDSGSHMCAGARPC